MQIILELFICGYDDTWSRLCYSRHKTDITDYPGDPDQALDTMLKNTGFDENNEPLCAHSTSWRYEKQKIVLTYLVWTDICYIRCENRCTLGMNNAPNPASRGRLSPRPVRITREDVLRHGLRHLSFLISRKNRFVLEAVEKTGSLNFFKSLEPAPAGRIHSNVA